MSRKPKTAKVARTRAGNQWTEAQFWQFIRAGLRKLSVKWPPANNVMKQARRPYIGENKRMKWEYQCNTCKNWFPQKKVLRDHITPCGSCRSYQEVAQFVEKLLVEENGYQILCEKCHQIKTNQENTLARTING